MLILILSAVSITWEIYSAKMIEQKLRNLTKMTVSYPVMRDGKLAYIDYRNLVVGDVVVLSADPSKFIGSPLACDLALIQGECVMDESSLTGETVPSVKSHLPFTEESLSPDRHKPHILFCGSTMIELKARPNYLNSPSSLSPVNEPEMALGIVMATGFSSTKGELFRSILYPVHIDLKFKNDSYKFLAVLGLLASCALVYRVKQGLEAGKGFFYAFINSLDLVTIAVPPALPLVLTVGVGFAIERLRSSSVFCINPERVNFAGRVDVMCWDKTGTLTVNQLKFVGVDTVTNKTLKGLVSNLSVPSDTQPLSIEHCMVACHSVKAQKDGLIGHSVDVEMLRVTKWTLSPTDSTELPSIAYLDPPIQEQESNSSMHIFKRFHFDSNLQRSSVVASPSSIASKNWVVYTKGSPESIRQICQLDTIPQDFFAACYEYAIQGYYVIACAGRILPESLQPSLDMPELVQQRVHQITRSKIERDLVFFGFMLFENPIKQESFGTIQALRDARIRSIIITGDNALTAIHVARSLGLCTSVALIDVPKQDHEVMFSQAPQETGTLSNTKKSNKSNKSLDATAEVEVLAKPTVSMRLAKYEPDWFPIDDLIFKLAAMPPQTELALTGAALAILAERSDTEFLSWIVGRCRIFSSTKPTQKTWIVEQLIREGKYVAMCGDGTNDCGALKAAHVGLALSDAEASIVAPFTSAHKDVMDVPLLIREGRCAIETSFVAFKYMMLYPVIQFTMAMSMYQDDSTMSNNQYLFDDLAIVTLLSLFMLHTHPRVGLLPDRPTDNLFSPIVLGCILGQTALYLSFYFINQAILESRTFYCSVAEAISKLDPLTFIPLNGNFTDTRNYPCYSIDPKLDTTLGNLIKSFDNTGNWLFGHFGFAIVAISVSICTRYRQPVYTNFYFTLYFTVILAVLIAMLLLLTNANGSPLPNEAEYDSFVDKMFNIVPGIPESFRLLQLGLLIVYAVLSMAWEIYIVDVFLRQYAHMIETTYQRELDYKRDRMVGIRHDPESKMLLDPLVRPSGFEESPEMDTIMPQSSTYGFLSGDDLDEIKLDR